MSLISGIVPSSMKPKSSRIYRPISNLSYISKTLERIDTIVCSQLLNYLDKHKLLNKFQSAYTINKSTETALTHILNKIILYPIQYCSIIILLDLSAAFDTISHDIMIHRLQYIGTTGTTLAWFSSSLSHRTGYGVPTRSPSNHTQLTLYLYHTEFIKAPFLPPSFLIFI